MRNIKSAFSYTVKNKMFRLISLMILLISPTFTMEYELPSDLKHLGLSNPKDFSVYTTIHYPHPILSYHLDAQSIEEMTAQYQVALQAKEEERNVIALKVLWDLAERGYAPANDDLADIFMHGKLGVKKNSEIVRIFLNRPYIMEEMVKMQNSVRYSWENKEALENLVQQARNALYPSCRSKETTMTPLVIQQVVIQEALQSHFD